MKRRRTRAKTATGAMISQTTSQLQHRAVGHPEDERGPHRVRIYRLPHGRETERNQAQQKMW